jgi:uncharacterized protein YgbK (DUF1537 family)
MIAVIADDLTGAAELGGLGLRYNLKVEIATEVDANTTAELLVISADTRSIKEEEAIAKIKQITNALLALKPSLIYKKIDSVLRGHVIAELKKQMEIMQMDRVLIIPANPYLERTIKDGQYFFKGEPIHLSSFSSDPEFPIRSSMVVDMLGASDVSVIKLGQELPDAGIAIGEVQTNEDLKSWAGKVDPNVLLGGAAGFFTSLLDNLKLDSKAIDNLKSHEPRQPSLFVCGTTFHKSRLAIKQVKMNGGPVSYMPASVINSNETTADYDDWSDEIVELLSSNGKAIIAIDESDMSEHANANDLREMTAGVVKKVLAKMEVKELIVEGGSTAASIIRRQNFTKLIPVQELSAGVIRMKVDGADDLHMTIKPGSYEWSPGLWKF